MDTCPLPFFFLGLTEESLEVMFSSEKKRSSLVAGGRDGEGQGEGWGGRESGKGKVGGESGGRRGGRERTERDNEKILRRRLGFSLRSGELKAELRDDAGYSKLMHCS